MASRLHAVLATVLALLVFALTPAEAREITDMTGRRVELPEKIGRIYATAPPVALVVYALDPAALIGWNFAPFLPQPGDSAKFLAPAARDLPVVGNLMGHGQQTNLEELLALKPDVVIAWTNPFLEGGPLEKALRRGEDSAGPAASRQPRRLSGRL